MISKDTLNRLAGCVLPADITKRQIKAQPITLNDHQQKKLMENPPKGANWLLIDRVEAFRILVKKKPINRAKIVWRFKGMEIGVCEYINEDKLYTL